MSYNYSPLPSAHHIRLLQICDDLDTSVIKLSLTVDDLEKNPAYTCLSYTWDSALYEDDGPEWSNATQTVELDGEGFFVRKNLYDALQHLRQLKIYGPIWIDAICINQSNIPEKNSQVANMYKIFEDAEEVVVWLGKEYDWVKPALKTMEKIQISMEEIYETEVSKDPANLSRMNARRMILRQAAEVGLTQDMLDEIVQFAASYRWFSRIWTVQEFLLGRKLIMLCGTFIALPETLFKGGLFLPVSGLLDTKSEKRVKAFLDFCGLVMDNYTRRKENKPWSGIGAQAIRLRSREATDPRDKIFAITRISTRNKAAILDHASGERIEGDQKEPVVSVDYSKSVQSVFIGATFSILLDRGVKALSFVGDRTRNKIENLPSWVIDFTRELEVDRFQAWGRKFCTGSQIKSTFLYDEKKPTVLDLVGAEIDNIEEVCDAFWEHDNPRAILNMYKLITNLRANSHADDNEVERLFWRTIIADGNASKYDETEEILRSGFERWILRETFLHFAEIEAFKEHDFVKALGELPGLMKEAGLHESFELMNSSIMRGYIQTDSKEKMMLLFNGIQEAPDMPHRQFIKDSFVRQWAISCRNRLLFRTKSGALGLGLKNIEVGDSVYIIADAETPYIFRHKPEGPGNTVTFEGDAYVSGIMYGEVLSKASELSFHPLTII